MFADSESPSVTAGTRWDSLRRSTAAEYQSRFDALAAAGTDVHGEARFVQALVPPGSHVLDAGCGTGRVAIALARQGYSCVGADADADMLRVARTADPDTRWVHADLSRLDLGDRFSLIVMAGNVIPLLAEGTLGDTMRALRRHVDVGGLVVAGFGLDEAHLPSGCPVTTLESYDAACRAAGLLLTRRYSTWDKQPFEDTAGYAVSVHERLM